MDGMVTDFLRQASPGGACGVLYIEDFDELPLDVPDLAGRPAELDEQPQIIVPGYTADDLEASREEGRLAALEEHATIQGALCTAALGAIADGLANGRSDAAAVASRSANDLAGTILALLSAALPATAARLAADEVGALLAALLPPLSQEPAVCVRVHPSVLPTIGDHLAGLRDVTATADASLAPSDVAVTWRDGGARRDWASLWKNLSTALGPFGLPDNFMTVAQSAEGASHGG